MLFARCCSFVSLHTAATPEQQFDGPLFVFLALHYKKCQDYAERTFIIGGSRRKIVYLLHDHHKLENVALSFQSIIGCLEWIFFFFTLNFLRPQAAASLEKYELIGP